MARSIRELEQQLTDELDGVHDELEHLSGRVSLLERQVQGITDRVVQNRRRPKGNRVQKRKPVT